MDTLSRVLALLAALAPLVLRGAVDATRVAAVLDLIVALGHHGDRASAELRALHEQLQHLAESDGPLPWDDVDLALADGHARLQALKDPPPPGGET